MEHIVDNIKSQMRKGLLEYCILLILNKKEAYASSIIEELKQANMIVVEGTLYPLLIRQNQGLPTIAGKNLPRTPTKYYMITDKGRSLISEMDLAWQEIVSTIETIRK